jgi:site-specific DNA recombinase
VRKPAQAIGRPRAAPMRCAIYTRKSSEEGLEQEFNSLDAQREACEAYIRSQRHEGWQCLPGMYDDGGISGATMERPSLKRLLADIEAGAIDAVVVYKVDRLTRSLADFAKIVEVFDAKGVSFVSVTQQFNTTTSMGRLTLNMLLSFAQFEREVTGERIRDKIAASKKRGMWMGGVPALGYDVKDKKLVVNEPEAERVRNIYRRYAALGSVLALKTELERDGIRSKSRVDRFGRSFGDKPLARGALYLMLQNRLYRGEVVHKDAAYPGEHPAIIDAGLWETVQTKLAANRVARVNGEHAEAPSLLAGVLYDETGERMSPTHANKKGQRYRYYVSQALLKGRRGTAPLGRRVPAGELEALIENRLAAFLSTQTEVFAAIEPEVTDAMESSGLIARAAEFAGSWPELAPAERRRMLLALLARVDIHRDSVEIRVLARGLVSILRGENNSLDRKHPAEQNPRTIIWTIPVRLRRTGIEKRLLIDGATSAERRHPDHSLCRLLVQAHQYHGMLMRSEGKTITQLAQDAHVSGSYFTRALRLSFLAPEILQAILRNRHPIELNAKRLVNKTRLPVAWDAQRALLGIG